MKVLAHRNVSLLVLVTSLLVLACAVVPETVNTLGRQPLSVLNTASVADDYQAARFAAISAQRDATADRSSQSTGIRQMNTEALFAAAGLGKGGSAASSKAGEKFKPLQCCQICPQKFYLDLKLMEFEESVMKHTYSGFHAWHSTVHAASKPTEEEHITSSRWMRPREFGDSSIGQSLSFLELRSSALGRNGGSTTSSSGKSGSGGSSGGKDGEMPEVPASVEALGQGPCCALCPDMFYPTPPAAPGAKTGGSVQVGTTVFGFLQTAASTTSSSAAIARTHRIADTEWRKKGTMPRKHIRPALGMRQETRGLATTATIPSNADQRQGLMAFLEQSELSAEPWTQIGSDGFVGSTCCKICPAQFFAPRSYGDVKAPKVVAGAGGKAGGAAKAGEAGHCCRTCPMRMMESATLDTMNADNGDMQPENSVHAAKDAYASQLNLPRNPANMRVYGAGAKGGAAK